MDRFSSEQSGLRKGAWTVEEDTLLRKCIEEYGEGKWRQVPLRSGLKRCRKSCRLRWLNYLRPNIKRGVFDQDEMDLIIRLQKLLGNRWSLIAGRLPGRTTNDIKNYWNSHLRKALAARAALEDASKSTMRTQVIKPRPRTFSINSRWFSGEKASVDPQPQGRVSSPLLESPQEEPMLLWKSILAKEGKENDILTLGFGTGDQLPVGYGVEGIDRMIMEEDEEGHLECGVSAWGDLGLDMDLLGPSKTEKKC